MKIVIVGGVAGGASAAARLRRLDESAEIVLFERGPFISFANCGLPYYVGDTITDRDALTMQTPESFRARFRVDVRVHSEVTQIDPKAHCVTASTPDGVVTEAYDKLILSPGASPVRPPMPGADDERVFTLRDIPDALRLKDYITREQVASAVVVGGGYIGIEMAENLVDAGCQVTVVELGDHILAPFDYDVAAELHHHLREKRVDLLLNTGVKALHPKKESIGVELQDGSSLDAGLVFLSVGVRPEGTLARDCGLEVTLRNSIVTDEHMRTSDPDIYALGDAVQIRDFVTGQLGFVPLAGPANKQGRIVADHICGIPSRYTGTQGTSILKCFDMVAACTGLNERTALAQGIDCEKNFTYSASHATYYPGAQQMSIKLVFERETGKVLGAQIVGYEGVDKRIDVIATAIRAGMTVEDLTNLELAYAPPFSSAKDPVNMAGYAAENIRRGLVKLVHWHQIPQLDPQEIVWLDVRTPDEVNLNGIIFPWAIHIPVDNLRERIGEIPEGKPVYVNCHSGLRSYLACRILTQKGFDCYNLSGGWRLWNLVHQQ